MRFPFYTYIPEELGIDGIVQSKDTDLGIRELASIVSAVGGFLCHLGGRCGGGRILPGSAVLQGVYASFTRMLEDRVSNLCLYRYELCLIFKELIGIVYITHSPT